MSGCAYFGDEGRGCGIAPVTSTASDASRISSETLFGPVTSRGHARAFERARERLERSEEAGHTGRRDLGDGGVGDDDAHARDALDLGKHAAERASWNVEAQLALVAARRLSRETPAQTASRRARRCAATRAGVRAPWHARVTASRGANAAEATKAPMRAQFERDFLLWCLCRRTRAIAISSSVGAAMTERRLQ